MSTHTVLLVLVGPLVNTLLLLAAWWVAKALSAWIPEGRFKRILYKKL
jgi:hypothetical protein